MSDNNSQPLLKTMSCIFYFILPQKKLYLATVKGLSQNEFIYFSPQSSNKKIHQFRQTGRRVAPLGGVLIRLYHRCGLRVPGH